MAAELEKLFASVARGGAASGQARATLRSTMSKLAAKHAPRASDESVVALITVTVENAGVRCLGSEPVLQLPLSASRGVARFLAALAQKCCSAGSSGVE